MGFYDWMPALHVLSAFAMAVALVLFGVLVFAARRVETVDESRVIFRLGTIGGVVVGAGSVLALILGVVLAIDSEAYRVWDRG